MNVSHLAAYRHNFWSTGPSAKERREKIHQELQKANSKYLQLLASGLLAGEDHKTPFVFMANGKAVCEKAFVNILALADNKGNKSKTWTDEVAIFLGKC